MKTRLGRNVKIVTQPEVSVSLDELTVRRIVDLPDLPEVRVWCQEIPGFVTIFAGDDYREWTKPEVEAELQKKLAGE